MTHHFRGIYRRIHLKWIKKQNRKMSTCNRLDVESRGSWPTIYVQTLPGHCWETVCPKNLPGSWWGQQSSTWNHKWCISIAEMRLLYLQPQPHNLTYSHKGRCQTKLLAPPAPCIRMPWPTGGPASPNPSGRASGCWLQRPSLTKCCLIQNFIIHDHISFLTC